MRISVEDMEKTLSNIGVFVSVDIETTGFSTAKGSEIIEIGAVMIDPANRKILKTFSELIKPRNGKISKKITEITNITNEMVINKEYIEPIIREFSEFIGEYPLVFHNAGFDWDRFLDPIMQKQGITKINTIIDTMPLTKVCLPKLEGKKLEHICSYYGYEIKNQHRAIADAKATGAIAVKYKEILKMKYNIDENKKCENIIKPFNTKAALPVFKIKTINCWKKAKIERIYLLTSWGNLYFDLNKREWLVGTATCNSNIDFNIVQEDFLKICNLSSTQDMERYFREKLEEKVS